MRAVIRGGCALVTVLLVGAVIVVFVVLVRSAVVVVQTPFPTPLPVPTSAPPPTATPIIVVPVGTTAHTPGWDFTVLNVQHPSTLDDFGTDVQPQGRFELVRLRITNRMSASSELHSWDFTVVDGQGRRYDLDENVAADDFYGVTVQPSLSTTTVLVFDVVPQSTDLRLQVQSGALLALGD